MGPGSNAIKTYHAHQADPLPLHSSGRLSSTLGKQTENTPLSKIINIQALRGVAVLLVVLFHLVTIEQKYGGVKTILPNFLNVGMFGVDLFFVISGFVMVSVTKGKFLNIKHAAQFLYHRASRIYPTYWVYSLLVLGVFLFKPTLVNSSQGNEVNIVASFLLLPSDRLPLVMVGWTLIHEMYFYLVYFFILLFISEKHLVNALVLWAAVIIGANFSLELATPFEKLVFHPLTIEFIFGCFVAIYYFRKNNKILREDLLLSLAAVGFIAMIYGQNLYYQHTESFEPQGWWRILIFGLPALSIVFYFINAERNGFVFHSSLVRIGDTSYSIYLSHILTLSAVGRIWSSFSIDSTWDNVIMIPILIISAIIVGMLSYRYVERPLLTYSRRIA